MINFLPQMIENLTKYYQKRAKEYDLVYQKPERQIDLHQLHVYLKNAFVAQNVLEIACGTGYWTKSIAETCTSILATDINDEVIAIATTKDYGVTSVRFEQMDFWQLKKADHVFDSVFGGFIWSHILKKELPRFLEILKDQLGAKGELIFIDNKYVKGSSTPIARTDTAGNTYQNRQLQNGEVYEVLKNFPTEKEVKNLIGPLGFEMEWLELEYYWILRLRKSG